MRWQPDEDRALIEAARAGGTFIDIAIRASTTLGFDVTPDMARNRLRRLGVRVARSAAPVIAHSCWLCRLVDAFMSRHLSDKPVLQAEDTSDADYWYSRGALMQLNRRVDAALRETEA